MWYRAKDEATTIRFRTDLARESKRGRRGKILITQVANDGDAGEAKWSW